MERSRNPAPGPLSHLRAPILATKPSVTELVTRHTVRTGREFALNLPMALFFILLPLLLLFAWIFPLLASCCLIQSCSDTAPLLGHRSLTHRLPTEQIHLLDSSKPKSSTIEVLSSSCLAGLTQHLCFYETQTTTSTTPVRLCRHGMFGPAPPRILDLHTRGCLRHLSRFLMQLQCRERSSGTSGAPGPWDARWHCPCFTAGQLLLLCSAHLGTLGSQWEQARSKSRPRPCGFYRSHHAEPCKRRGLQLWQQTLSSRECQSDLITQIGRAHV